MQAVFTANIKANIGQLAELFKAYDLATIARNSAQSMDIKYFL